MNLVLIISTFLLFELLRDRLREPLQLSRFEFFEKMSKDNGMFIYISNDNMIQYLLVNILDRSQFYQVTETFGKS